jgi:hypothetical protein
VDVLRQHANHRGQRLPVMSRAEMGMATDSVATDVVVVVMLNPPAD